LLGLIHAAEALVPKVSSFKDILDDWDAEMDEEEPHYQMQ